MKLIIEKHEVETNKALIIAEDKGGLIASLADGMSYEEAMDLLATLSLHVMNAFVTIYPNAREDIYQDFNMKASNVLASFIPDKELRPDLTADAIVRMENSLVEEQYAGINREQRRNAKKTILQVQRKYAKKVR